MTKRGGKLSKALSLLVNEEKEILDNSYRWNKLIGQCKELIFSWPFWNHSISSQIVYNIVTKVIPHPTAFLYQASFHILLILFFYCIQHKLPVFFWFYSVRNLELKQSNLSLFWRCDLWVSSHKMLSILFQLSRVCHPVRGNVLHMWVVLCSFWKSFPDLIFFVALLYRVPCLGSQKQVRKYCFLPVVIGSSEVAVVHSNDEFAIQNVSQNIWDIGVYFHVRTDHLTSGFPGLLGQVSIS